MSDRTNSQYVSLAVALAAVRAQEQRNAASEYRADLIRQAREMIAAEGVNKLRDITGLSFAEADSAAVYAAAFGRLTSITRMLLGELGANTATPGPGAIPGAV